VDHLHDLHALQTFVEANWPFNNKNYPRMPKHKDERQLVFVLNHLAKHLQKEVGKLIRLLEPWDHGKPLPENFEKQMADILRDFLVLTLRMNALEGRYAFDLALSIRKLYRKKKRPRKK